MLKEGIAVLDFGGQYAHLEANRVRRLNVYSEIVEPENALKDLSNAKGFIFSGGPSSVYDEKAPRVSREIYGLGIPILAICFGHQLVAQDHGGKVRGGVAREYGKAELKIKKGKIIFDGLGNEETVWMSHGDALDSLPCGFEVIGRTQSDKYAAIASSDKKIYSLQFHPEVTHTVNGMKIFENFTHKICGCKPNWTTDLYIAEERERVKSKIGNQKVLALVSGGVDSTAASVFIGNVIGFDNEHILHVNAFLRKNETEQVVTTLKNIGITNVHVVEAENDFLNSRIEIVANDSRYGKELKKIGNDELVRKEFDLKDGVYISKRLNEVANPEVKRWIIGKKFVDIADEKIRVLGEIEKIKFLMQGTLYPDFIESGGTKHSVPIKSHHNNVPAIEEKRKRGELIEPWLMLYKDEVRKIALQLGLPEEIVYRHPFPGPGLAVRILCSDGSSMDNLDGLNEEVNPISRENGYESLVLPLRSVGVQGDERTYKHPVCIFGKSYDTDLEKVSTEITNKVKAVNRVVQLVSDDKISSVSLKSAYLTKDRLELEREADYRVMSVLRKYDLVKELYQFPVVLAPISVNGGNESVILRPIKSEEAMTADVAYFDNKIIDEMVEELLDVKGIDAVFFDHSKKPPGTIEWE